MANPFVHKGGRWNIIRKLYSHLSGIDVGSTPVPLDFTDWTSSGIMPVVIGNDAKFPVNTVTQQLWYAGGQIGDSTNPDMNVNQVAVNAITTANTAMNNNWTDLGNGATLTLPAGKTLYITAWAVNETNPGGGLTTTQMRIYDKTNSAVIVYEDAAAASLTRIASPSNQVPIKYANPSGSVSATIALQGSAQPGAGTWNASGYFIGWYQ